MAGALGGGRVAYSCAVDRQAKLKATGYGQKAMVALPVLVVLTALFIWWSWRQGAYFDQVFYPGTEIGAYALFASDPLAFATAAGVPAFPRASRSSPCSCWPVGPCCRSSGPLFRRTAIAGAERAFLYVALFALGGWLVPMLGGRHVPAVAPVALAGALVSIAYASPSPAA